MALMIRIGFWGVCGQKSGTKLEMARASVEKEPPVCSGTHLGRETRQRALPSTLNPQP